jgi:light-regulated signal transduction histidine kinase (bacteriophytochrome)
MMGILIDSLLSFSRVQKTDMSISVIDMDKLAGEVWSDIRQEHPERELEVEITRMLPGYGDRNLIRQVFFNLLSNAVKFTKNRKPGTIFISSHEGDGHVVYCLKDNGVGFDMDYYDKLFGVFQRLHSQEEFEGTGVGLAIVQRIISRHGGRVWAEGKVDEGASFYFSLSSMPKKHEAVH